MSLFGTIMSKVFGSTHSQAPAQSPAQAPGSATASSPSEGAGASPSATAPNAVGTTAGGVHTAGGQQVDIAAVLDGMEGHAGQQLNWRESIVDLMKLLGMDSSLSARKELARELDYTGSTDDSAAMNIWLHKEVMMKFAANGGKLPDDLKHA